jgi:hypothetical protein
MPIVVPKDKSTAKARERIAKKAKTIGKIHVRGIQRRGDAKRSLETRHQSYVLTCSKTKEKFHWLEGLMLAWFLAASPMSRSFSVKAT